MKKNVDYYDAERKHVASVMHLIDIDGTSMLHREDGPALVRYYENGSLMFEGWYVKGICHREDGPAKIWHDSDGSVNQEAWRVNGTAPTNEWIHARKRALIIDTILNEEEII